MILKIAGIVLCEITVYVLLKQYKPEFAVISEFAAIVLILFMLSDEIKKAVEVFSGYFGIFPELSGYITVLMKVLGIAILTQLTSDMCRDAGESALASKVEFSGKIIITAAVLPVMETFTALISRMVENV